MRNRDTGLYFYLYMLNSALGKLWILQGLASKNWVQEKHKHKQ